MGWIVTLFRRDDLVFKVRIENAKDGLQFNISGYHNHNRIMYVQYNARADKLKGENQWYQVI